MVGFITSFKYLKVVGFIIPFIYLSAVGFITSFVYIKGGWFDYIFYKCILRVVDVIFFAICNDDGID